MKLHLPKMLLAAVLVCVNAYALTVDTTTTPGSTIVTSADGTWTKTYTNVHTPANTGDIPTTAYDATILENVGLGEDNLSYTNIANAGDIVVGGSGYLNLQTWLQGAINLNNDIYLGTSSDGNGALWLKEYSGTISLNGKLTLVENSSAWMEGKTANAVTINGDTIGSAYNFTLKGVKNTTFNGAVDLGGITSEATGQVSIVQLTFTGDTNIRSMKTKAIADLTFDTGTNTASLGEVSGAAGVKLTIQENATLNITGDSLVLGGAITNNGTLNLNGASMVINSLSSYVDATAVDGYVNAAGESVSNGFKKFTDITIIQGSTVIPDSTSVNIQGTTVTVDSTGKLAEFTDKSAYFMNTGAETFGGTDSTVDYVDDVKTIQMAGGTLGIAGGNLEELVMNGESTTVNMTGGSITTVDFANTGNLNFKLAEGQSSTSYTLDSISYTTRNNYERNVTIDSGVSVNLATLNNGWGMGTLTVNGELSVSESLSMATGGNNSTTNNVITGSGTINTTKLIIGNAGTYNVSGVTMNIGSGGIELTNDWSPKLNLGAMTLAASADWTSEEIKPYLVATESASTVVNTNGHTIDLKVGVQGTGNLTKTGEGTLKMGSKTNALSGAVEVSGGSLSFYNAEEDASTTLDNLTLSGGSLDVTGSLTLNALSIDLSKYSTDQEIHTLVSAGTLILGEGVNLSSLGGNVGNYTATVEQSDNSITLSFSEIVAPGGPITTTVTSQGGFADGMLTLNVDGDLTSATQVFITGISDSIMAEILGLSGLPAEGMVGITLQGAEGGTFTADDNLEVGFYGKDGGIYFGENVGGAWQYQVAYIPEPASATLGLAALMMLAARRRRKA